MAPHTIFNDDMDLNLSVYRHLHHLGGGGEEDTQWGVCVLSVQSRAIVNPPIVPPPKQAVGPFSEFAGVVSLPSACCFFLDSVLLTVSSKHVPCIFVYFYG
jgi:hypothetical protein